MEKYLNLLYNLFIVDDRYMLLLNGLIFTLGVTFTAAVIGILLGMLLSIMMIADLRPFKNIKSKKFAFLKQFNPVPKIALFYITVIRGTPTVVQLFILAYVIFVGRLADTPVFVTASLAFGLNSAAYVAEIIRAGIQGLDKGQMEAARALGMSYRLSMRVVAGSEKDYACTCQRVYSSFKRNICCQYDRWRRFNFWSKKHSISYI